MYFFSCMHQRNKVKIQIHGKYIRNTWEIHVSLNNTWEIYVPFMSKYMKNTWEIYDHFTSSVSTTIELLRQVVILLSCDCCY